MTPIRRLAFSIPLLLIVGLTIMCWVILSSGKTRSMPSMTGEPLPRFVLPTLDNPNEFFSSQQLKGQVVLINVWASWCSACQHEHAMLMEIKNKYHVPIYGILYRDQPTDAIHWLKEDGNPYMMVGQDPNGDTSIDLGIYGTPETFIINKQGKIIYRQVGVISQSEWQDVLYPMIQEAARE